jgi:hypothetical protein
LEFFFHLSQWTVESKGHQPWVLQQATKKKTFGSNLIKESINLPSASPDLNESLAAVGLARHCESQIASDLFRMSKARMEGFLATDFNDHLPVAWRRIDHSGLDRSKRDGFVPKTSLRPEQRSAYGAQGIELNTDGCGPPSLGNAVTKL